MQHLNYAACADGSRLRSELEQLGRQKFLTPQQLGLSAGTAGAASASPLRALLPGPGWCGVRFSVLDDSAEYIGAGRRKFCCKGVTDCYLPRLDGLDSFLDFKRWPPCAPVRSERARYCGPIAYSRAISRIFELPVSERIVYFFAAWTPPSACKERQHRIIAASGASPVIFADPSVRKFEGTQSTSALFQSFISTKSLGDALAELCGCCP